MSNMKIFINGLIKENPVLVLMIGMCPSLAVTTAASNGIGMGLATTFVLLGSNIVISLLKKVIPGEVRLPAYIVIIAGFVTIIGFLLERYFPDLNKALGLYVALIVVNCIILARAEAFAAKNSVIPSMIDGIGMGVGFTCSLSLIAMVRELLGAGSLFGISVFGADYPPALMFILAPGGFLVLGLLLALINKIVLMREKVQPKKKEEAIEAGEVRE